MPLLHSFLVHPLIVFGNALQKVGNMVSEPPSSVDICTWISNSRKATSDAQWFRRGKERELMRGHESCVSYCRCDSSCCRYVSCRNRLQTYPARTDAQKTVPILVANGALAFGAPIGAKDLRGIDWPVKSRPDGAFSSFSELVQNGRRVAISPFVRDELIIARSQRAGPRASLISMIEKDKRAVWAEREVSDGDRQSDIYQCFCVINRNDCRPGASL